MLTWSLTRKKVDKEVMDKKKEECPTKVAGVFWVNNFAIRSTLGLLDCMSYKLCSFLYSLALIVCAFPTQYSKWVAWNNCSWPQWRFLISFILLISALQHSLAELPYLSSLLVCLFVPPWWHLLLLLLRLLLLPPSLDAPVTPVYFVTPSIPSPSSHPSPFCSRNGLPKGKNWSNPFLNTNGTINCAVLLARLGGNEEFGWKFEEIWGY